MLRKINFIQMFFLIPCRYGFENLALRRPAWELHPWPYTDRDYGSQNAVDGLYSNRTADGGQCSISANNNYTEALWRVDLGEIVSISHINIFYMTDNEQGPTAYESRMAGFFIYVSNTTLKEDGYLCFHDMQTLNRSMSEDQRINCTVYGRYVIYYNERKPNGVYPSYYSDYAFSELCEVEVYGCRIPGYFGEDCNSLCPINCQEKKCDIHKGHCLGCLPGYKGESCNQICEGISYGLDCAFNCSWCRNGTTCHHKNGTCIHGCDDGLTGDKCQIECSPGYYGNNCLSRCNNNCNVTSRCDKKSGQCEGGCKKGWTGKTCDKECSQGYYGNNCLHRCNNNCNVTSRCDKINGQCEGGCKKGWIGKTCDKECSNGTFGYDCLEKCGHCLYLDECNHINGSCLDGCSQGFKGELCREKCPFGYFGIGCLYKCDTHCSGKGACNPVNGVCDQGCKAGWTGSKCGTVTDVTRAWDEKGSSDTVIVLATSFVVCVLISISLCYIIYRISKRKRKVKTNLEEKVRSLTKDLEQYKVQDRIHRQKVSEVVVENDNLKQYIQENFPGNEHVYYVEKIIRKRTTNGKTEFLVKLEGYEDPTWVPERNIPSHIIEKFL